MLLVFRGGENDGKSSGANGGSNENKDVIKGSKD